MHSVAPKRIGFIGLGVMGEAMCRNLIASRMAPVTIFDLATEPVDRLVADGAVAASSTKDLAEQSDMILLCLPGGDQVRTLCFAEGGVLASLTAGKVLVDMSTSPPALMRELAMEAAKQGAFFADAPIARTRQAAADGTLAIMVGAEETVFEQISPVLRTMGTDIVHCGGPGAGQTVKIMNNMVLFQTVNALAEALEIGTAMGVEASVLLDVMGQGSADSFALRNHGMKSLLPEVYPERAFSVSYADKDLSYALAMAEEGNVEATGAEAVKQRFADAIKTGLQDQYFPTIRNVVKKTSV